MLLQGQGRHFARLILIQLPFCGLQAVCLIWPLTPDVIKAFFIPAWIFFFIAAHWKSHTVSRKSSSSSSQAAFRVASTFLRFSKVVLTTSTCLNALSGRDVIGCFAPRVNEQVNIVPNKVTSSFKPLLRVELHFCFWGFSSCFFFCLHPKLKH